MSGIPPSLTSFPSLNQLTFASGVAVILTVSLATLSTLAFISSKVAVNSGAPDSSVTGISVTCTVGRSSDGGLGFFWTAPGAASVNVSSC